MPSSLALVVLTLVSVFTSIISASPVTGLHGRQDNATANATAHVIGLLNHATALDPNVKASFDFNDADINAPLGGDGTVFTLGGKGNAAFANFTAQSGIAGSARRRRDMSNVPMLPDRQITWNNGGGTLRQPNALQIAGTAVGRQIAAALINDIFNRFQHAVLTYCANRHIDMTQQLDIGVEIAVPNANGNRHWILALTSYELDARYFPGYYPPSWGQFVSLIQGIQAMLLQSDTRMLSEFMATFTYGTENAEYPNDPFMRVIHGTFGLR